MHVSVIRQFEQQMCLHENKLSFNDKNTFSKIHSLNIPVLLTIPKGCFPEVLDFLVCYTAYVDSCVRTFWYSLSVSSSKAKQF